MKKIFGALMIAVCIGMAMPAQAQILLSAEDKSHYGS